MLHAAMAGVSTPGRGCAYPAAVWVGSVNLEELVPGEDLRLAGSSWFRRARLLIWERDAVRGFVELDVKNGVASWDALCAEIAKLPPPAASLERPVSEPTSVIVCTRDRPEDLAACLSALSALDYADYEIIVIDSASLTTATREVVEGLAEASIRYHRLDKPGLSRSRNTGVELARHDRLAFTDDDVIVDKRWLSWIDEGFGQASDISCVTGLVASGQLESDSQHYFDRRVTWASKVEQVEFRLREPPADVPLFPFQFGVYGTGANFAIRRDALTALGGFDNALGAGSTTGAGEDTDIFVRLILQGHAILYQPNAVVWHKHRTEHSALTRQLENYGVGIGAVITKLLRDRRARRLVIPLAPRGIRHAVEMVRGHGEFRTKTNGDHVKGTAARELLGLLRGPMALYRARRHEARLARDGDSRSQ